MDIIRLAARIVLNTAQYSAGLKKAEQEARSSSESISRSTDAIATSTERANEKMMAGTRSVVDVRQDLLDNIAEIKASFREEVSLFQEGAISSEEYADDIAALKEQYKDAKKELREFDAIMGSSDNNTSKHSMSMRGLSRSTMLAVSAIAMLTRTVVNSIKQSYAAAKDTINSGIYYNVSTEEYSRLKEMFRAGGSDEKMANTLLDQVYSITKGIRSGDSDTLIALQKAGIDLSSFEAAGSDADRVVLLLSALQSIGDINERRSASVDLFGDDVGRSIQQFLLGSSATDLYNAANIILPERTEELNSEQKEAGDAWSRFKTAWQNAMHYVKQAESATAQYGYSYDQSKIYKDTSVQNAAAGVVNGLAGNGSKIEVNVSLNGEEIAKAIEKQTVVNGSNAKK